MSCLPPSLSSTPSAEAVQTPAVQHAAAPATASELPPPLPTAAAAGVSRAHSKLQRSKRLRAKLNAAQSQAASQSLGAEAAFEASLEADSGLKAHVRNALANAQVAGVRFHMSRHEARASGLLNARTGAAQSVSAKGWNVRFDGYFCHSTSTRRVP